MDKLNSFVQSMASANEALREAIELRADGVGRMEHFEELFLKTKDNFLRYRQKVIEYESEAEDLQKKFSSVLQRQNKEAEDLRRQLVSLSRTIEEQESENKRLEDDLKGHVERLQKLKYQSESSNAYANASLNMTGPFIHHLCNDLNKISLDYSNGPPS